MILDSTRRHDFENPIRSRPEPRQYKVVVSEFKLFWTAVSDRITIDPAVCHGKPCIRGLRYPVENVLEWLASGMSTDEILKDYEDLEREDILAALSYAARLTHVKRLERLAA